MFQYALRNPITAAIATAASVAITLAGCSSNDTSTAPEGTAVSRGQALVVKYDCVSCHQDTGGKTLAGRTKPISGTATGIQAYGPNLTPDTDTGLGGWTDAQLVAALKDGKDDEGAALCSTMPSFAALGDSAINDIVAYLRSLPAVANQAPESVCPPLKTGQ